MVAITLVPAALAAGLRLESAQFVPVGVPTITQPKFTIPVNPFRPFTRMVSVIFEPTLVAIVAVFAVTVKSFTESVTLVERVRLFNAALMPEMATVAFAPGVVPKVVCKVTIDWFPGVVPGVTIGGTGVQVTPAGSGPQPTAILSFIPPNGV